MMTQVSPNETGEASSMSPKRVRVAYIGNFRRSWCTEVHVKRSLESLGHQVFALQEDEVVWPSLPQIMRQYKTQLLLWTRTWVIDTEAALAALDKLSEMGIPTASFHLDRWWGLDREAQIKENAFFRTGIMFSPDGDSERWKTAGVNHYWMPPGVVADECSPVGPDRRRFPHDVVFVGTHPYPHPEWRPYRSEIVDRLSAVYGDRFHVWPDSRGPVRGKQLQALYASAKVVVGDSCLVGAPQRYWSDRIPETLGRGGFLVHPEVDGLEEWYRDGVDLCTYPVGDFKAMLRIVDRALESDEERQKIAAHGRTTVLARDTYRHRMAEVISVIDNQFGIPETAANGARTMSPQPRRSVDSGVLVRHVPTRQRARFEVSRGTTDEHALHEVWTNDNYNVTTAMMTRQVVVDIGANVGAFSVLAARVGATKVFAYEPNPDNATLLLTNVTQNGVKERVNVREMAVTGDGRPISINGIGSGTYVDPKGSGDMDSISINQVLAEALDVAGVIGVLKIDCEGSEFEIIEALDDRTFASIRSMVMEFHGPVMPHLSHLSPDLFGPMVTKLAQHGKVRIAGMPTNGGLIWWSSY